MPSIKVLMRNERGAFTKGKSRRSRPATKNFIAGAIKKPGALRATAKREGLIKDGQKLSHADLEELRHSKNATTRRRAVLAETLAKLRKRRK